MIGPSLLHYCHFLHQPRQAGTVYLVDEVTTGGTMTLSSDPNFLKLQQWYQAHGRSLRIRSLFEEDPQRFSQFR